MSANANLVHTTFTTHTTLNDAKSKKAGRPIFDEMDVIEFRFAGDKHKTVVLPALDIDPEASREAGHPVTYAQRYDKQYQDFKDQSVQSQSGTPVEELPFLTQAKRRELKALNIYTAEALAALDGQPLKRLGMGGRELKNQAQAYLDNAASSADTTALAAELASLRQQIVERDEQIAALAFAQARQASPASATPNTNTAGAATAGDGDRASVEKSLEECTDAELKEFIKRETGESVKGNPNRQTLIDRAMEIATAPRRDAADDEAQD